MKLAILIIIVILIGIGIGILRKERSQSPKKDTDSPWPYKPRTVLTSPEQVLFFRLVEALPEYVVLSQVGLSRVIDAPRGPNGREWFGRISQKTVDFVICSKDFRTIAAIELDDASHQAKSRQHADNTKDRALASAGIRVIRWTPGQMPTPEEIRNTIEMKSVAERPEERQEPTLS